MKMLQQKAERLMHKWRKEHMKNSCVCLREPEQPDAQPTQQAEPELPTRMLPLLIVLRAREHLSVNRGPYTHICGSQAPAKTLENGGLFLPVATQLLGSPPQAEMSTEMSRSVPLTSKKLKERCHRVQMSERRMTDGSEQS
ncbi:hypothetical protein EYF80_024999 [Liparis tanakae]|uniref:Uncharacterized protein n=1 Tax=Liparis tanakae TaxID=230148 RepID=A0A4Z2HIP4_9TELE|nr:hypothetical protein EYF80_024999 [Liparis tanakae]